MTPDQILDRAEQKKVAADPVRNKQREVEHVKAAARKLSEDYKVLVKNLRPRMDVVLGKINRLFRVRGPIGELKSRWDELEKIVVGGGGVFDIIVQDIDTLNEWRLGQPADPIHRIDQRLRNVMGNLSAPEKKLKALEQKVDEFIEQIGESQGNQPMTISTPPEKPQPPKIDNDFEP